MERDKMAISQGNNHQSQTEAPLCQRANGWSALYGTSPHAIWSIVSCEHFVRCAATQTAEEWKKHLSMCRSSCHRWPAGKYFELVNWLPESDGRYYSHWQERVSRGRRGGVQNELRPGSLWHQRIADIILLLYPVCCSGLGDVWADLCGSGQNWCAALHLHMSWLLLFCFFYWMNGSSWDLYDRFHRCGPGECVDDESCSRWHCSSLMLLRALFRFKTCNFSLSGLERECNSVYLPTVVQ